MKKVDVTMIATYRKDCLNHKRAFPLQVSFLLSCGDEQSLFGACYFHLDNGQANLSFSQNACVS